MPFVYYTQARKLARGGYEFNKRMVEVAGGKNTPLMNFAIVPDLSNIPKVGKRGGGEFKDLEEAILEGNRRASRLMAKETLRIVQNWLRPHGETGIGWTGRSAMSLRVSSNAVVTRTQAGNGFGASGGLGATHYVYASPEIPEAYIREGLQPGEVEMAEHQDFEGWKKWAKFKGLKLLDLKENKYENDRKTRYYASHEDQKWATIAARVRRSVMEEGTSDYAQYQITDWTDGRRYFNWPQKFSDDHAPDLQNMADSIYAGYGRSKLQMQIERVLISSWSTVTQKYNTGKFKPKW